MNKKILLLTTLFFILASCAPAQQQIEPITDVQSQVNTAIAQTMEVNTQIAQAVEQTVNAQQLAFTATAEPTFEIVTIVTDTPIPSPANTPTRVVGGGGGGSSGGGGGGSNSSSQYSCAVVAEKPYDGATFKPGDSFDKSWTIKNTGTATWQAGWDFEYRSGTDISPTGNFSTSQEVKPGGTITLVIEVDVPDVAYKDSGKIFVMTWSLNNGTHFCTPFVAIKVVP